MGARSLPAVHDELGTLDRVPSRQARAVAAAIRAATGAPTEDEQAWIDRIEALREQLDSSTEEISVALPNIRGMEKTAPVGEICRRRSKKPPWCRLLLGLARHLAPKACLELGTCLGVSTAYLAAGLRLGGGGRLVSLEGANGLARRAAENLWTLGLDAQVRCGLFNDTLQPALDDLEPIGLAFVDGHHQEEPTLEYFERILPHLGRPSVVVLDDIRWSEGMERAWERIVSHDAVGVAVDITAVGVCVVHTHPNDRLHVRFPTMTAIQKALSSPRTPPVARLD